MMPGKSVLWVSMCRSGTDRGRAARVQEVPREVLRQTAGSETGGAGEEEAGQRVFVIDSDERRAYEQGKREQSMERTRLR